MFWGVTGRTMLRDEAHAFLQAGAAIESADMVLRMLRVALPLRRRGRRGAPARRPGARAAAGRRRLPGLSALVPRRPTRGPVARFLLFERDYPDSVAFSIEALHNALTAADPAYRSSPAVLRLVADDRRPRLPRAARRGGRRRSRTRSGTSSASSRRSMSTSPSATLAAPRSPSPGRSPHELRDPLPDRVPLRVAGHGQPQRAAREAGDDGDPERRGLRRARGPRVPPQPAPRLLRHDRDRVRDLAPARAPVDRRPRARAHQRPRRAAGELGWAAIEDRAYDAAAGEFVLPVGPGARRRRARRPRGPDPRRDAAGHRCAGWSR